MTDLERVQFEIWLRKKPKSIQKLAKEYPPDITYGLNNDGDDYQIYAYGEDGTVSVVRIRNGKGIWRVFGVDPKKLTRKEK